MDAQQKQGQSVWMTVGLVLLLGSLLLGSLLQYLKADASTFLQPVQIVGMMLLLYGNYIQSKG